MFSLLLKPRDNEAVYSSGLYSEVNFYPAFIKDIKRARKSIVIESPFLTQSRALQLANIFERLQKKRVKVVIYTRIPQHQPYRMRDQAIISIYILRDAGAVVYECRDYRHRKVAIIDKQILWEGSLNILSQSKSRETMRRIVSGQLAKQMLYIIKH